MEWSKLPTNLITSDLSDAEILAIVKYQLVFSLIENEPSDKILNKFLTKKQKNMAKNFIADIKTRVENDIKSTQNKRKRNKTYYNNTKGFDDLQEENSDVLKDDCQPPQTREDKIRQDKNNKKEKEEIKEKFDEFFNVYPLKFDEYKTFILYSTLINEKTVTHEELIKGVESYKRYIDAKQQTEIKQPFNWLKDMSWKNNYDSVLEEERKRKVPLKEKESEGKDKNDGYRYNPFL